jgi:hypothetical protein
MPDQGVARWLQNLIVRLENAEHVDLSAIVTIADRDDVARQALVRVWKKLDERVFLGNSPIELRTELIEDNDTPKDCVTLSDLQLLNADVVAWMCPQRPPAEVLAQAEVWSIAGACRVDFGLAAFVTQQPASECHVIRFGGSEESDTVLLAGAATTDRLSLCRGLSGLRAVANALFLAALSRLSNEAKFDEFAEPVVHGNGAPGLLRFVIGLGRLYGRYCFQFPRRFFSFNQWQIAYRIGGDRLDQEGLSRLAPDHSGFWADPFVHEHQGRKMLFFEEILERHGRGHICAMELGPDGAFDRPIKILMRPYHLSYPFLFEYQGSIFMIPESAEAGKVEAFRCTQYPETWEWHSTLLENIHAYDTTLVEHEGLWWMFMTVHQHGNSPNDELHLYFAESPFGKWIPHPLNPISLDVRSSRPAGQLYRKNGKLYRPAQDCSGRYGRAIVIREVRRMTTTDYEEVTVEKISAAWARNAHATHTVNQSAGLTVYDCEVRRRKRDVQ